MLGQLPCEFFRADEKGRLSLMDVGFSSTSDDGELMERLRQETIDAN